MESQSVKDPLGGLDVSGARHPWVMRVGVFLVLPVLIGVGSFLYVPRARAVISWLNGCGLAVDQPSVTVDAESAGESVVARFVVRNVGSTSATIFGVETSCSCTTASNLPLTIPANEERELLFSVRARSADALRHDYQARPLSDSRMCPDALQITLNLRTSPASAP